MRRGLVVGKFMPLHRGHQLLIETALTQVDELTVVIYDSAVVERWANKLMPAATRARWIAELYPGVHNIVSLTDTLEGTNDDHDDPKFARHYADQVEFLGPFTHVFSSEEYGEAFAQAINTNQVEEAYRTRAPKDYPTKPMVQHVTVDQARTLVPISGTEFRRNMYENRVFVDPYVYRDLVQKVVFVGTESTGKSTISKAMAQELNTLHTEEYGRSLWIERDSQGVKPSFHDLLHVGQQQYMQEQAAQLHANRWLFCDTNAWTTMLWSEMYYGSADTRLMELALKTKDEYIWFLCSNDFGWVDDGYRELKGDKSTSFHWRNVTGLERFGIDYHILAGPVEQRIQQVKDDLGITMSKDYAMMRVHETRTNR